MTTDNIILNNKKNIIRPSSSGKVEECPDGHICMNGSQCVANQGGDGAGDTTYSCDCASAIQSQGDKKKEGRPTVENNLKSASKNTFFTDRGNNKSKPSSREEEIDPIDPNDEDAPTSFAGVSCEYRATQYCAYDSIFSPHHFCVNEGECGDVVPEQHPRVRVGCICPDDFEGPHCEYVKGSSYSSSIPADLYSVTPPSSSKPINSGMSGPTTVVTLIAVVALIGASLCIVAATRTVRQKRKQADADAILAHSGAIALTEPGVEMKEIRNGEYENPTVEATPVSKPSASKADEQKQVQQQQSLTLV